jgi:hypothetical protein
MREIRLYGSEGGGTGQPVLPTPIPNEALTGWRCVQPALSRLRLGSPGLESRVR